MEDLEIRRHILSVCKSLHSRNLLAAADGNVSVRTSDERILITPSGRAKAFIETEDIAVMNLQGETLAGKPSGESLMHLEVYRRCPKARAVVHAHPPNAIAWSLAYPDLSELPSDILPEVMLACGRIPIVPYARPTTAQMAERIRIFLPTHRVMILARHGGLSWGGDLDEAHRGMERLEHASEILRLAKSLGPLQPIDSVELGALRQMRETIGERVL